MIFPLPVSVSTYNGGPPHDGVSSMTKSLLDVAPNCFVTIKETNWVHYENRTFTGTSNQNSHPCGHSRVWLLWNIYSCDALYYLAVHSQNIGPQSRNGIGMHLLFWACSVPCSLKFQNTIMVITVYWNDAAGHNVMLNLSVELPCFWVRTQGK